MRIPTTPVQRSLLTMLVPHRAHFSRPVFVPEAPPLGSIHVAGVPCATPWFCGFQALHNIPPDRKQHMCLKWCLEQDQWFLEMPRDQYCATVNAVVVASVVTQFLLPLLADRTFASAERSLG